MDLINLIVTIFFGVLSVFFYFYPSKEATPGKEDPRPRQKAMPIKYENVSSNSQNLIYGNMDEKGNWTWIDQGKKYDISKSIYIWGTGSGLTVRSRKKIDFNQKNLENFVAGAIRTTDLSPRCEMYQTKDSKIFFLICRGCFVSEYSREEVKEWLNAHSAPSEVYKKAEIGLRDA